VAVHRQRLQITLGHVRNRFTTLSQPVCLARLPTAPGSLTSTGEYRSRSSPRPSRPKDPRPQMKMRPSAVSASVCVPPHAACTTLRKQPATKLNCAEVVDCVAGLEY